MEWVEIFPIQTRELKDYLLQDREQKAAIYNTWKPPLYKRSLKDRSSQIYNLIKGEVNTSKENLSYIQKSVRPCVWQNVT